MGNDRLSGKQVGSQASLRVTRRLAWTQPVCKSIYVVPALKGLIIDPNFFSITWRRKNNFLFKTFKCALIIIEHSDQSRNQNSSVEVFPFSKFKSLTIT